MIKIESDSNIAVVSMDEYNEGKQAINDFKSLKSFMQTNLTDKGDNKYHFIVMKNYLCDFISKYSMKIYPATIIHDVEYQEILTDVKTSIKNDFKERDEALMKKENQLNYLKQDFNTKLEKAKNIKWYHLLFGWKKLDF